MSAKPPLLLLHGVTMSGAVWNEVVPMLEDRFDVIAPTAAGHRGGPPIHGAATLEALVDSTEQLLDERGLSTVHLAGNSMGGWIAIELARRGRARSVCALSPAGLWGPGGSSATRETLIRMKKRADSTRRITPTLLRFAWFRRAIFRDGAENGQRMSFEQAVQAFYDLVDCDAAFELFDTKAHLKQLSTAVCPITVAWSANDRVFPPDEFVPVAREMIPHARFVTLADVGHVPMIDDPNLCADVIAESTRAGTTGT